MVNIPEALRAIAVEQRGMLTRQQCLDGGIKAATLDRLTGEGGAWQRVLPRVYTGVTGDLSSLQWAHAALLSLGEHAVLSGATSLRLRGMQYAPADERVHVLLDADRRPRKDVPQVVLHRTRRLGSSRLLGGLRHANVARAAADAVRWSAATDRESVATLSEVGAVGAGGRSARDRGTQLGAATRHDPTTESASAGAPTTRTCAGRTCCSSSRSTVSSTTASGQGRSSRRGAGRR
jgi:hypothetical protein